jgi:hypothetical protein
MKACREWRYSSTHSWPLHLLEVNDQLQGPAALQPGKEPGTHWNGASLNVLRKEIFLPLPGIEPRFLCYPVLRLVTVQNALYAIGGKVRPKREGCGTGKCMHVSICLRGTEGSYVVCEWTICMTESHMFSGMTPYSLLDTYVLGGPAISVLRVADTMLIASLHHTRLLLRHFTIHRSLPLISAEV